MAALFVDVAPCGVPLYGELTYSVPPELEGAVCVGKRVLVPLKNRRVCGYITALKDRAGVEGLRAVVDVLDEAPLFDQKRLKFFRWLATYYFIPLGEALSLMTPPSAEPKSFRYITLTEEGRRYIECGDDRRLRELLEKIKGGRQLGSLLKAMGSRRGLRALIERAKAEGLVEETIRVRHRRESLTTLVRLLDPAGVSKRARLQHRVVELLKGGDRWVPLSELRASIGGGVLTAVRALERRGVVETTGVYIPNDPLADHRPIHYSHDPTEQQRHAIEAIKEGLGRGFAAYLLWGVTGSGKTLVYLEAIEEALRRGKRALFLVPEIALTIRPASYLLHRFGDRVAVVHSSIPEAARFDSWRRILRGEVDVVVGTRSALFMPIDRLGIIIVDEEHDPSYKQTEAPRYNARDCALMLAKTTEATVVLGSATPSAESFYNAQKGRLRLLRLKDRAGGAELPAIEIVDMRKERSMVFSERLVELMGECLSRGEQAMLFLNRRGFSNFLLCRDCGYVAGCPNCTVSLRLHRKEGVLRCHYCEFCDTVPSLCPSCGGYRLRLPGIGTERVEDEIGRLFPGIEAVRIDRDTVKGRNTLKELIERVEERRAGILLGTQMVSKGHHFPHITLVGIVDADVSLNMADFRSTERTFQLILQAAGRAGRGGRPARVVVQTYMPEHPCFAYIARHDYGGFMEQELRGRAEAHYPPHRRLALLRVEGTSEAKVLKAEKLLARACMRAMEGLKAVEVLGPAEPIQPKLRGRFRRQALVKAKEPATLHRAVSLIKDMVEPTLPRGVSLVVDIDPVFTG